LAINKLDKITKLYFTYFDVAKALKITEKAAIVTCSRYVKTGFLIRLKKNIYVKKSSWNFLSNQECFEIANLLQVPSYISFTTALSYYGLTTQIQQNYFESAALKRTHMREIFEKVFNYSKIKKELYFGFERYNNFFIALPEKAILDSLYLQFLGKYKLDLSAIAMDRINIVKLEKFAKSYTRFFKKYLKKILLDRH